LERTIASFKRDILAGLLKQLNNEISNLDHRIEEDVNIPEDDYRVYEKQLEKVYSILQELDEEITFS
jgi:hypothetical protein